MTTDILEGAVTLDIGNPRKVIASIAREAVRDIYGNPNQGAVAIYSSYFGWFISGLDGVAVNDDTNQDAMALWALWDAKDSKADYATLFDMFINLSEHVVNELADALYEAHDARYKAPIELSTPVEQLDPNSDSGATDS